MVEFTAESILQCDVTALTEPPPTPTPSSFTTWDPATATSVTLSGGNVVATSTGTTSTNQGAHALATSGQISGKFYFELRFTTVMSSANATFMGVGIGTTSSTYSGMGVNAVTGDLVHMWSGAILANGSSTSHAILGLRQGETVGVAVDLDSRKIWFKRVSYALANWNDNGHDNPATNVGGFNIPAGTMVPFVTFGGSGGASGDVFTANFGASSFIGAVPSGYTAGWPA